MKSITADSHTVTAIPAPTAPDSTQLTIRKALAFPLLSLLSLLVMGGGAWGPEYFIPIWGQLGFSHKKGRPHRMSWRAEEVKEVRALVNGSPIHTKTVMFLHQILYIKKKIT